MKTAGIRSRRILPALCALLMLAFLHGSPSRGAPAVSEIPVEAESSDSSGKQLRVDILGGVGAYQYSSGCGSTQFRDRYLEGQARLRYRTEDHWVVAGNASVLSRISGDAVGELASEHRPSTFGMLGLRVGHDWRYGGLELGGAVGRLRLGDVDDIFLMPSGRVWVGLRDKFEVWTSLLAEQTASLNRVIGAGFTVRNQQAYFSGGVVGSAGDDGQGLGEVGFRVSPRIHLLITGSSGDEDTWSAMTGVSITDF
jgi:hypothetical protein